MTRHEAKSMFIQPSSEPSQPRISTPLTPTAVVSPNEITRSIAANAVNEPHKGWAREGAESR